MRIHRNILTVPAGTETAIEIWKSLTQRSDFSVYGADTDLLAAGSVLTKALRVPDFTDPLFWTALEEVVDIYNIDLVFPTHDSLILPFAERSQVGKAKLVSQRVETAKIVSDKRRTYDRLQYEVSVPRFELVSYPLFMKPAKGRGSIDAKVINNREERDYWEARIDQPITMEYLPGKEFTIDCVSNYDGKLLGHCARERIKIQRGITTIGRTVKHPELARMAEVIAEELKLRGAWFFQVKQQANGNFVLLEVNARVSGTMCLTRMAGINMPLITSYVFLGDKQPTHTPEPIIGLTVSRHLVEEYIYNPLDGVSALFLDLDDTVWLGFPSRQGGTVAPRQGIGYILNRVKERGIKIYAVSHNIAPDAVQKWMNETHLGELFTSIYVEHDVPKSATIAEVIRSLGITQESALFIDDTESERVEVKINLPGVRVSDISILLELTRMHGVDRTQQ